MEPTRERKPEHTPKRPTWQCRVEGEPWPCPAAREKLRKEYVEYPTTTALYLSSQQHDYLDDTPDFKMDELYERFFGWVR